MAVEVRLPQLGMAMQEGTINQWLVGEGDEIAAGNPLVEIEAEKVVNQLPAPATGTLRRILVPGGETVPVNTVLAVITAAGEAEPPSPLPATATPTPATPTQAPRGHGGPGVQVTPRARRLAADLHVDLGDVSGTGPGGRIVEDDIRTAAGSTTGTLVPMTGLRRAIAEQMTASLAGTAQLTLIRTCDVTALVAARGELPEPRPTFTDYVVRAAALSLVEHPRLNATTEHDGIRLYPGVHAGIAVAVPDGLIVAVVRNAETKPLRDLAAEARSVIERVRGGTHSVDDVSGSTFTVTSLGGHGVDAFTPILNPPEVAILGVGRITEVPARDADALVWRSVTTLSLTIDHRAVDGVPAADFLAEVARRLESPLDL